MGRKFVIDLDDSVFNDLRDAYMEVKKSNPTASELTFEEFLVELLKSYADTKKQMDAMGDQFKNMMDSLGGKSFEEMLNSMMGGMGMDTPTPKKPAAKKPTNKANEKEDVEPKSKSYKS